MPTEYICSDTKCKYKIKSYLTWNANNIIYPIAYKCHAKRFIGSANRLKRDSETIKVKLIPVRLGVE